MDQYWPEDLNRPQRYGDVTVEVISCRDLDSYVIRSIIVSMVRQSGGGFEQKRMVNDVVVLVDTMVMMMMVIFPT